jgi:hypothetical protein
MAPQSDAVAVAIVCANTGLGQWNLNNERLSGVSVGGRDKSNNANGPEKALGTNEGVC